MKQKKKGVGGGGGGGSHMKQKKKKLSDFLGLTPSLPESNISRLKNAWTCLQRVYFPVL